MADKHHEGTHKIPKWLVIFLITGAVVVTIIAVGSLIVANRVSENTDQIAALEKQNRQEQRIIALNQCKRLNQQRQDDNNAAWFQQQADLKLAKIIIEPGILKVLNVKDKTERVSAAAEYKAIAQSIRYEPPTNCVRATDDPHYKRPFPQRFPKGFRPSSE
jgi:hypothetical protein